LDIDPRDGEALGGLASSYQKSGRISEAEATYIKAAAVRPNDWSGYNSLGNFYDNTGRQREAINQYQRALHLTADNSVLYANLGAAYLNSGDLAMLSNAESALKKSIEINPNYAAYANLGNLYGVQGRFAESAAATEKALQIDDLDYDVWNNLADAYEWLGENNKASSARSRAIEGAERVVKLNPQDAEAHATLAALLAKNKAREESMTNIQISLALSPNSQYVLSEVADAYASLGDRQNAIKYIEQAIKNGFPIAQLKGDPYLRDVVRDIHLQASSK
jgi:Flp pilus assembly protein TadD